MSKRSTKRPQRPIRPKTEPKPAGSTATAERRLPAIFPSPPARTGGLLDDHLPPNWWSGGKY